MEKEYWVNVYEFLGVTWQGSPMSLLNSDYMIKYGGSRVAYRIHVKMKPTQAEVKEAYERFFQR